MLTPDAAKESSRYYLVESVIIASGQILVEKEVAARELCPTIRLKDVFHKMYIEQYTPNCWPLI